MSQPGSDGITIQPSNTIIINSGAEGAFNTTQADACFIRPMAGSAKGLGPGVVFYDTSASELKYSTT